jgi:hypothetical protein
MGDRAEPRFKTDTLGVIEVIRDEAYTLQARIADVSGIGFQLEMTEPLELGETVRLTVDGYQMLGEVRRCIRDGTAYNIGVERVDAWNGTGIESTPTSLGRPVIKHPLGSLRAVAMRELFADPRLRDQKLKCQTVALAAAVAALAAWAGISALLQAAGHK